MQKRGQGAFEYILLLAGVLLVVILAVVILRGGVLTQANNQIAGSLNTYFGTIDACTVLSQLVIHPQGTNATLTLCRVFPPASIAVYLYSTPLVFNGSTDLPANMTFSTDEVGNTRIFLNIVGKNGTALNMSESHHAEVYVNDQLVAQNLPGTIGETGAPAATPTTTPTPTPESWPMFHHDAQHLGYTSANGPLTNVSNWTFTTPGTPIAFALAATHDRVYIGSLGNKLFCLYPNRTEIWNFTPTDTSYSFLGIAISGNVIFATVEQADPPRSGKLYALNASTGAQIWGAPFITEQLSWGPTIVDGVVYLHARKGAAQNNTFAVNATTGTQIWGYRTPMTDQGYSVPAVANGVLYFGAGDGNINGKIYALNASTGAYISDYTLGGKYQISSPTVYNGVVYIGSDGVPGSASTGAVYALNASDITQLIGGYATPNRPVLSTPAVANGTVYVGAGATAGIWGADGTGAVYALNASNVSQQFWNYTTGSNRQVGSSPAVANGVVYAGAGIDVGMGGSGDGAVYAVNASTGAAIWSLQLPNDGTQKAMDLSSPVVVEGRMYIGSYNNTVYAFGPGS